VRLDSFGAARRDFRARELDGAMLAQLQTAFDRVRAAGFKVVLRFSYSNPTQFPAVIDDDATEERIRGHIGQLAPVLARNADVIALVEAGFVGAWGEWHNSTSCLTADLGDQPAIAERCRPQAGGAAAARRRILDALLAAVPAARAIAVRQPRFRVEEVGARRAAEHARSGAPSARIGFHDDCLLASASDMGTFAAWFPAALLPRPGGADDIAAWRAYTSRETEVVPFGGETCQPVSGDDAGACGEAQRRLRELHTTYLNSSYYRPTLDRWKSERCYDDVGRHLGYRLEAVEARWSGEALAGQPFRLEVQLRNQGWAPPINARPLRLVVDDGARAFVADLAADVRPLLRAGETRRFDVKLALPAGAPPGLYRMFLWLPDPAPALAPRPEYSVRLANAGLWRAEGRAAGMNELTTPEQPLVVAAGRDQRPAEGGDTIPLVPLTLGSR
jgi:hypothetical protein